MSKSKRNTVDPTDIMASYGADTARWFMLSDSPPDRDVIWTEESVAGAARFVQRVWRLVGEAAGLAAGRAARRRAPRSPRPAPTRWRCARSPIARSPRSRRTSPASASMSPSPRSTSWPTPSLRALAILPQQRQDAADHALGAALREALEMLVAMMAPMMPHLAEECWAALGHGDLVATRAVARGRPQPARRGHRHAAGPGEWQQAWRIDNRHRCVTS